MPFLAASPRTAEERSCAALRGLWTDDGVDVWTLEASGKALFNGKWVGRVFDVRPVPTMRAFVRGDGWATFLRDATDSKLVWRKSGQEPIVWTRYTVTAPQADAAKKDACESEGSTQDEYSDASGESWCELDGSRSRVRFNLSSIAVFEVTPYSEVFGIHPREFDFDADYALVPAQAGDLSRECLESEGPEEDGRRVLSLDVLLQTRLN